MAGTMAAMATKKQEWMRQYVATVTPEDGCTPDWPWARWKDGRAAAHDGKSTTMAGRVTWMMLHGKPFPADLEARHTCGNGSKACVNPHHIVPGSRSENIADRYDHGWSCRGERSVLATLTEAQVVSIRERVASGESQVGVARDMGITNQLVSKIWLGTRWKSAPGPTKGR